MSKQLKPQQWLELFNIYETLSAKALWYKYATYREINKNTKQVSRSSINVTSWKFA